jgi:CRP-like cAMP-binding protein
VRKIVEMETAQPGREQALALAREFEPATKLGVDEAISPCTNCSIQLLNVCNLLLKTPPDEQPRAGQVSGWQFHKTIRAGKNIISVGEKPDWVYVICAGWSFRFAQLPDGRRQILSILLPGDVVTTTGPYEETVRFSVQASTEVRCSGYSRRILNAKLHADPELLDAWTDLIVAERRQNFSLLIDLGCRSAEERISRLLLDLRSRLQQRGMMSESPLAMPLSRRLIAGATALTPEHVSRVIGKFREMGLVETSKKSLTIIDPAGLELIGRLNV